MASLRTAPVTPGLMELLADLVRQILLLLSLEVDLARSELAENSARAARGLGAIVAGAVFLLAGFFFLLAAACAFLVRIGVPVDVACLIVAVVVLLVGGLMLRSGARVCEPRNWLPRRTLGQISSLIGRT